MSGYGGIGGAAGSGSSSSIAAGDSPSIDAFGRWRTSDPKTIFESQLDYDEQPLFWETVTQGGGSTLYLSDESALEMECGTADGDLVIRQTYTYFRYQPGKSQLVILTAVLGEARTNVEKRVGYFDGYNGLFFEQDEDSLRVVKRSSASGLVIDTTVEQSDWNIDKFDGTGPSGITLDITKSQIFLIDFQWLGVGRVRFGLVVDGNVFYCHQMVHANTTEAVYMETPNLPLRYEIENIGATTGATSLKQICSVIISEGGFDEDKGIDRSVDRHIVSASVGDTTQVSVLAVRPKATFNSLKNRGQVLPLSVNILATGDAVHYELIYRGTVGGSPTWTSVGADSITEYSTDVESVSGGVIVQSGYIGASSGQARPSVEFEGVRFKYILGSDFDGGAQDEFIIRCIAVGQGTPAAEVFASIIFKERF
jgi:hypothetical protein